MITANITTCYQHYSLQQALPMTAKIIDYSKQYIGDYRKDYWLQQTLLITA